MTTAAAETYDDVARMITSITHSVAQRYGGEVDEMKGQANLGFAKAYSTYDMSRARFSSHCYRVVQHELLEQRRRTLRHQSRFTNVDEQVFDRPRRKRFSLARLLNKLSITARSVVCTITMPSPSMQARFDSVNNRPKAIKRIMRDHLLETGFTEDDVELVFTEISLALQDADHYEHF